MRGVNRIAAVVLCLCATIFGSVGAFAGRNPGRTPVLPSPDMVFDVCGPAVGPVLGFQVFQKAYAKTFVLADGTVKVAINGNSATGFTRLSDGKTLTFNSSGPATLTFYADGNLAVVGRGLNVVANPTGIWQYAGRLEVDLATGLVLSHSGRTTDICALLMP